MLKAPDGLYRWKRVSIRSGEMLKVKPYKTEDLEVTGIYDGEGKYTGMAGGVVVNFNGVAVRCGSGFDDATREAMAKAPNDYIGKVAEIRYLEVTEDGSLRHPSFLRWREEKD
jgi:ATP-dependent DNA ligase